MLTLSLCLRYTHRYLEIGIEIPKTYYVYIYTSPYGYYAYIYDYDFRSCIYLRLYDERVGIHRVARPETLCL